MGNVGESSDLSLSARRSEGASPAAATPRTLRPVIRRLSTASAPRLVRVVKNPLVQKVVASEMQRYLQMITLNFALVYAALRDRLNAASIGGET